MRFRCVVAGYLAYSWGGTSLVFKTRALSLVFKRGGFKRPFTCWRRLKSVIGRSRSGGGVMGGRSCRIG